MSGPADSHSQPAKAFSISFGSKPKTSAPTKVNTKKRSYSALVADDSGGENDEPEGKSLLVSSFDHSAGGAITLGSGDDSKRQALVIPSQKNRDWREGARGSRGKNLLPPEEQARRAGNGVAREDGYQTEEKQASYGLVVPPSLEETDVHEPETKLDGDPAKNEAGSAERPKTEDEEALDALMGKTKKSTLVIEGSNASDDRFASRATDEDAFRSDVAGRPDSSSLADYDAVPIEEFGAALLRGMGWKEGDSIGRKKGAAAKPRNLERRSALLGIGAKEVPDGLEELGAWGKGSPKVKNIDRSYNPLVLRNAKTGEMLTEEQLKARQEQNKFVEEDWRDRRDRNLADDERKKSSRKHGDKVRDRDYDSSRHSSSRRDRSRSRERHRRGDRDRDRDRDDERDRRKDRHHRDRGSDNDDRHRRRRRYSDEGKGSSHKYGDDDYDRSKKRYSSDYKVRDRS